MRIIALLESNQQVEGASRSATAATMPPSIGTLSHRARLFKSAQTVQFVAAPLAGRRMEENGNKLKWD